jgi:hypothetical protein
MMILSIGATVNEYTKLVLENVDPAARRGPALQLPQGAVSLRHCLRELRDQLVAADPRRGSQPPEVLFNKEGVQADIIVEALLTGQVVHRDALYAAQTEGTLRAKVNQTFFNSVWSMIAQIEGLVTVSD